MVISCKNNGFPAGVFFLVVYCLALAVTALAAFLWQLEDLFLIFLLPILYAAVHYPRRIYLCSSAIVGIAALSTTYCIAPIFLPTLKTASVAGLLLLCAAELLHRATHMQKKAIRALANSEERYRNLVNCQEDLVWMVDIEGRFLFCNDAAYPLLGYSVEELLHLSTDALLDEKDARCLMGCIKKSSKIHSLEKQHHRWELLHYRKDGSTFLGEVRSSILRDEAGCFLCVQGITRDITAYKHAERALVLSEERYRSFIEELPLGVCRNTVEGGGRFLMANSAIIHMTGFPSRTALLESPVLALYPSSENRRRFIEKLRAHKSLVQEELLLKKRDGSPIWVQMSAHYVRREDRDIEYIDALVEDITEKKAAEKIIEEQRLQLLHTARLSAVGAMAGNVAHEINNPLAIISIAVEQMVHLLHSPEEDSVEQRIILLNTISRHVDRIQRIVRGLRMLSRDGTEEPFSCCAIREIIKDSLELCRAQFRTRDICLHLDEISPFLSVECRATQLAQVCMNLLNNARDAAEDGAEKWVRVSATQLGNNMLEIAFEDSGKGIPPDFHDKILTPFFTTKPVGRGTGLGLSISNSIIESHQGALFLDTASAHTRFVIHLPQSQAPGPLPQRDE